MQRIHGCAPLREALNWHRGHRSVGLVITRGNLHEGHTELIRAARRGSQITVVCASAPRAVFVDEASHARHPRYGEASATRLEDLGVDYVFEPEDEVLYPTPARQRVLLSLPEPEGIPLTACERHLYAERATLQLRLLNLTQPDLLWTSTRDPLSVRFTEHCLSDLNLPTELRIVDAVRHEDGLLVAGRNQFLSSSNRPKAPILFQTLRDIGHALTSGARHFDALEQTARIALKGGGFKQTQVRICDADTLAPAAPDGRQFCIFGSGTLDGVRLQDHLVTER